MTSPHNLLALLDDETAKLVQEFNFFGVPQGYQVNIVRPKHSPNNYLLLVSNVGEHILYEDQNSLKQTLRRCVQQAKADWDLPAKERLNRLRERERAKKDLMNLVEKGILLTPTPQ